MSSISTAITYHDMPSHTKYISAHNYNMQKYVIQASICKFSSTPFSKKLQWKSTDNAYKCTQFDYSYNYIMYTFTM